MITDYIDLDLLDIVEYLANELEELSKHKDILGDDFLDWD